MYSVKSPILFLVFNRPKETQKVFDAIRKSKPKKLYIAADGPRLNDKDVVLCNKTKDIVKNIDWDCEIETLYRDENLGCKNAVSQAITWFFENEEEGIILEDDCVPNYDFFRFCDDRLEQYRDDNRIGHICGCNFQDNINRGDADYYYSNLTHVWGWASWRRVWADYDVKLTNLEIAQENDFLSKVTDNKKIKNFIYNSLSKTKRGLINTWDYQYFFSNTINGYLSVIPNNNMIINVGFNNDGTHTIDVNSPYANMEVKPLPLKIVHPTIFVANRSADSYSLEKEAPSMLILYYSSFKQLVKKIIRKK